MQDQHLEILRSLQRGSEIALHEIEIADMPALPVVVAYPPCIDIPGPIPMHDRAIAIHALHELDGLAPLSDAGQHEGPQRTAGKRPPGRQMRGDDLQPRLNVIAIFVGDKRHRIHLPAAKPEIFEVEHQTGRRPGQEKDESPNARQIHLAGHIDQR